MATFTIADRIPAEVADTGRVQMGGAIKPRGGVHEDHSWLNWLLSLFG